jgi:hypothetical protein
MTKQRYVYTLEEVLKEFPPYFKKPCTYMYYGERKVLNQYLLNNYKNLVVKPKITKNKMILEVLVKNNQEYRFSHKVYFYAEI